MAGCSQWPRAAHLPAEDPERNNSSIDPRTLIELDWLERGESEPNDQPNEGNSASFEFGSAYIISAVLEGVGWSTVAIPTELSDPECASTGVRSPIEGDYLADVDVYEVQTLQTGTLCATLEVDLDALQDPTECDEYGYGGDLLVFELDACGIPGAPLTNARGDILGFGIGGPRAEWGVNVSELKAYAILVGGFCPNAPETPVAYQLGISMVPPKPDGSPALCPLLPAPPPVLP
jgi:hypothetical protein